MSAGTLNAYHSILEKNRSRMAKEHRELMKRKEAADASSQRRAELSTLRSFRSRSQNSKYKARTPCLSEGEVGAIKRNLMHSFLTEDMAGMLRTKNLEAATAQLAVYLLNYPPPAKR